MNSTSIKGFTFIEVAISISVLFLVASVVLIPLLNYRKSLALQTDTDTITAVLREARNQTLSSKNSTVYGAHITSTKITLFTGASYSSSNVTNKDYALSSTDTIVTINLLGGGSDVVFDRLTGETSQSGTVVVSSPGISRTKTVTIYKTGLIE